MGGKYFGNLIQEMICPGWRMVVIIFEKMLQVEDVLRRRSDLNLFRYVGSDFSPFRHMPLSLLVVSMFDD